MEAHMPTSPSTLNYSVLKGQIYFTPTGGSEGSLGNAPEIEATPEVDKLDHFSSMAGVRSKDRSVVREKTLTLRVVLDEITPENLRLVLLGGDLEAGSTTGADAFGIFASSEFTGAVRFAGANDIGNKVSFNLPRCSILPSGTGVPFISDEWAQIELNVDVLFNAATNDFGTAEVEHETETA
jgi:hypothetical protein